MDLDAVSFEVSFDHIRDTMLYRFNVGRWILVGGSSEAFVILYH